MRSLMFLLFLALFCSLRVTSNASEAVNVVNLKCCFEFSSMRIPLKRVVSYYWTSSSCAKHAIVFRTVLGKELCVDPEASWVNSHVHKVDMRTSSSAPTKTSRTPTTVTSTSAETANYITA